MLILKSFFLLHVLVNFRFLSQDFVRELEAFSFSCLSFWVSVFDIMDDQATILATCEELLVVETKSHSFNLL
jgi:hypothetical protein